MKVTGKKKPIHTIPGGVWESSRPRSQKGKKDHPTLTTDLQVNSRIRELRAMISVGSGRK